MGEAAQLSSPGRRPRQPVHSPPHRRVELGPAVPGDGGLEGVGQQAEAGGGARVDADEAAAPAPTGPSWPVGAPVRRRQRSSRRDLAAASRRSRPRRDVGRLRQLGRLEADDDQSLVPSSPAARRLRRVEDAEVRRPELGLDDVPDGLGAGHPGIEHTPGGGPEVGPAWMRIQASVMIAEDALASRSTMPIRARAGAAAGQPSRLPPARGVSMRTDSTKSSMWVWLVA